MIQIMVKNHMNFKDSNDGIESIESTKKLTILNEVMKELLANDYVLDFDFETF